MAFSLAFFCGAEGGARGAEWKPWHLICERNCQVLLTEYIVPLKLLCLYWPLGFPNRSGGKESACNAGDSGLIPRLGRSPGEGNGCPVQYSCLENPHGQKSLVGYSP